MKGLVLELYLAKKYLVNWLQIINNISTFYRIVHSNGFVQSIN